MTSYTDKGAKPDFGAYRGYDHVVFWVGNAKQAATYYCTRFGFAPLAYRGLETGHRDVVSHAVRQRGITFVFQSPLNPGNTLFGDHQSLHGDGVRDVAFGVENCRAVFNHAVARGAKVIRAPWEERDAGGVVVMATVATYGDTVHTLVERKAYKGEFLPGYAAYPTVDPLCEVL